MLSKSIIIITIIIIITVISLTAKFVLAPRGFQTNLVSPEIFGKVIQRAEPTITPAPKPKQFKFNSSTSLEQELDSVNPVVHDSDFEQLKILIKEI